MSVGGQWLNRDSRLKSELILSILCPPLAPLLLPPPLRCDAVIFLLLLTTMELVELVVVFELPTDSSSSSNTCGRSPNSLPINEGSSRTSPSLPVSLLPQKSALLASIDETGRWLRSLAPDDLGLPLGLPRGLLLFIGGLPNFPPPLVAPFFFSFFTGSWLSLSKLDKLGGLSQQGMDGERLSGRFLVAK